MNPDLRTMMRDSAMALACLVAIAGLFSGWALALGTLVSGLAAMANFVALAWVIRLVSRAAAAGRGTAPAMALIFGKSILLLVLFGGLVSLFGSLAPALGAGSVILGLCTRGVLDALTVSDDELPEGVR